MIPMAPIDAPTATPIIYTVVRPSSSDSSSTGSFFCAATVGSETDSGGGVGSQVGSRVTKPSYSSVTPVSSDQTPVHGFSSVKK